MAGKSRSYTDSVLSVLRGTPLAGITPYVGQFSVAPVDDTDAGTELAGDGYERQAITFGAPATDAGNVRKVANTISITFGPALAAWPEAVAFGVFDGQAGALLYWDALTAAKTVEQDDSGTFDPGTLVVKED
jgi:hypothetical protein